MSLPLTGHRLATVEAVVTCTCGETFTAASEEGALEALDTHCDEARTELFVINGGRHGSS